MEYKNYQIYTFWKGVNELGKAITVHPIENLTTREFVNTTATIQQAKDWIDNLEKGNCQEYQIW